MKGWISAIGRAYQVDSEALASGVDEIFAHPKMPFAALEVQLRNITKVFCENKNTK